MRAALVFALLAGLVGCGGPPAEPPALSRARARFPTAASLHEGVIQRSCSPNPGVCHNSSNYPDLSTAGALAEALNAPCNVEIPDPRLGWNRCERSADVAVFGGARSRIAEKRRSAAGVWRLELEDVVTRTGTATVRFLRADGTVALDLSPEGESTWVELRSEAGSRTATVSIEALVFPEERRRALDPALGGLVAGDPNGDGVFGADAKEPRAALIRPGDPDASYLYRRLVGNVPGTKMPLANAALSEDELLALECWIRGPAEVIDYFRCAK